MDLNLKGNSWAGKIYHQFESLRQDFDDLISKDSVKSVENQMQIVGISVKRFYSNVVQDILPVPGDIVRSKSQSVDGEQIDMWDDLNSATDIKNSDTSLQVEVEHVTQSIEPPHEDSSQEAETDSCLTEDDDDDAIKWKAVEDNIALDSIPVTSIANSDSEIFIGTLNEFPNHEEGSIASEKEKRIFNQQNGKECLSDKAKCLSYGSDGRWLSKLQMVEDPNSDDRSLCAPPVASVHKDFQSPEFVLSYFSCEEEEEQEEEDVSIASFVCSTSTKYSHILDSTCANVFEKAEPNDSAYNISTPSSTIEDYYERKAEDMLPAFLIMELNDDKALPTAGPDSVLGSSDMKHERSYKDGLETAILPSETDDNAVPADQPNSVLGSSETRHEQPYGKLETAILPSETDTRNTGEFGDGIDDNYMETVDLSPDVKHDDISVCLNTNFVRATFHQRKSLKYYKKLIKDAFTSQKRLSKEYEHLAILYGDIDMNSSLHLEPTSSPNISVHALPSQDMSETEWELI